MKSLKHIQKINSGRAKISGIQKKNQVRIILNLQMAE